MPDSLDLSIAESLAAVERLARQPTVIHVEQIAPLLELVADSLQAVQTRYSSERGGTEAALDLPAVRNRIFRLKGMLDSALQIRLGMARVRVAGLAGYSASGELETAGQSKPVSRQTNAGSSLMTTA